LGGGGGAVRFNSMDNYIDIKNKLNKKYTSLNAVLERNLKHETE
jgi:hypothetical protein